MRKRASCGQNEPDVVSACYSSVPPEPFLPFPFPLLYAARAANHRLISTPKVSVTVSCTIGLRNGFPQSTAGFFASIPYCIGHALFASFDTKLSRSTLSLSSSTQMTTVHPILVASLLHQSHQLRAAFRGSGWQLFCFFLSRRSPKHVKPQTLAQVHVNYCALQRLAVSLLCGLLDRHAVSDFLDAGLLHALQRYFCFPLGGYSPTNW